MKTRMEILNNIHNINHKEVEKYVDRITESLLKHHTVSRNISIGCGLTDYNKMIAQSVVSRLQSLGYYAKYGKKSSPWRYFVTVSVYPIKEENPSCGCCITSIFKYLFK